MANFPYNTTGFVISFPPATASAALDITPFFNEADNPPFSSSILNINGINIQLYRPGLPGGTPSNTPDTIYIDVAGTLSGTLPIITTAFNASSSIVPYSSSWSDISASDNGTETLYLGATNNGPQGNNYYYTSIITGTVHFTGGIIDRSTGTFAGFTPIASNTKISSLLDFNSDAIISNEFFIDDSTTYNQGFSRIVISRGALLLYPISTTIPQI